MSDTPRLIRIGHSPDADDAFMFYGLTSGHVSVPGFRFEDFLEEIQVLNGRARQGELEVSALSAASFPAVADKYRVMRAGAALGRGYGPIVVATRPLSREDLSGATIAVPGLATTAYLLYRLYMGPHQALEVPFDQVEQAVKDGQATAGIIIHEGQINYRDKGFHLVADLAGSWQEDTGLPVPLGIDAVRRDLGEDTCRTLSTALRRSIEYALAHPEEAGSYALRYGRGMDLDTCLRFARMYVNEDTIDMGDEGIQALETLYRRSQQAGLLASVPAIDPV